jgi:hypothetical protein
MCQSFPFHYTHWNFVRSRAVTKRTLFLRPKQFFVPVSPPIETAVLKHHTWHFHPMRRKQSKFGQNRAATKGSLIWRPKQYLLRTSPPIPAGWPKHQMYSHAVPQNQCWFSRNRPVTKGTILLRPKASPPCLTSHCRGMTETSKFRTPIPCATTGASLVETGP